MTEIDPTLPEPVKKFLRSGAELQNIKLDAAGEWTHEGLQFENQRIVDLFSRSVGRTEGGTWVLEVGRFTYPIEVEDTGYFVERIDMQTVPPTIGLSDGTSEPLALETLSYRDGGRLYCRVKSGSFRARFLKGAYYTIAESIDETAAGHWELKLGDASHPIATTDASS